MLYSMLVNDFLIDPKVAQPKSGAIRPQIYHWPCYPDEKKFVEEIIFKSKGSVKKKKKKKKKKMKIMTKIYSFGSEYKYYISI